MRRLPHVSGDELTATELLLVEVGQGLLAEWLEHGEPELSSASAMAASLVTLVAALDAKRGASNEISSPSLEALGLPVNEWRPAPGSGEWLNRAKRFATHLQTADVQKRL